MEIKTALFKLAFFEPNLKDENDNQIIDYLILDCLSAHSPLLECNATEIAVYIKNTFSIEFDEAEILKGAERLDEKGHLIINESGSKIEGPRFKLVKENTNYNQDKIKQLEVKVLEEWSEYLINKYKSFVNQSNAIKLIETLQSFITKMLILHGKESVATLYPDNPKTQKWLDEVQEDIIKDLPKLGKELDIILQIEIPLFFKEENNERKEYLNNLFNASFLWHLIQIDDTCSEYFKQTIKGQLLILDNNILFSLIGLHGVELLNAIHNLLIYANQLGYKIIVTTKTLDEFYESIQKNTEKSFESFGYSKSIATAATEVLESNNFLVNYWKEFIKNGLTVEEFAVEKSHIKSILDGFNISIIDDYREDIEKSQELLDEESLLVTACPDGNFSHSVIEHDAFHRILIKKIRNGYKYKYSEAKAWFLTHDSKLPVYARFALKGKKALPFCISTNEWIQINRPLLTRMKNKEEFERSFQTLVTQPFLRSVLSSFKVDKIKEKLLTKLNRYNNIGTQLAFDLATDVHFLYSLSKLKSDEKIEQKIEAEIVEINENLKAENKEIYTLLEDQEFNYQEKIDSLNTSLEEVKRELIEKEKNQTNILTEFQSLQGSIDDINKKLNQKENESEAYKEKLKEKDIEINNFSAVVARQKATIKWGIYGFLLIFGSLTVWFIDKIIDWQWLILHNKIIALKISTNIVIVIALLNIPLSKHWKIWLGIVITVILAILTFSFA